MIDTKHWKDFNLNKLFFITAGKYYSSDEYVKGNTPYISASATHNGIAQRIDLPPDFEGNLLITGKIGSICFYQTEPFCATSDVNVFKAKNFKMNKKLGLYLASIINFSENYKWSYGRQCRVGDSKKINIKLPVLSDKNGQCIIDPKKTFSDEGYIPDWEYMEKFIERLETRERESQGSIRDEIRTKNDSKDTPKLNVNTWEEFILKDLFKVQYGVNLELNKCLEISNGINFVSRTSENNGISSQVEEIDGLSPQSPGLITVAGGGSVLSTFLQNEPFYSGRDLYTLECKKDISNEAKLFIITVIEQNKYKYNYGRQANRTLPDLILKLPIERNAKNKPVIDENKIFSPKGYIPDWDFMENYIKSLPYGDKI